MSGYDTTDDDSSIELLIRLNYDGELDGAMAGIARQAAAEGLTSLTSRQREVVEDFIERKLENKTCLLGCDIEPDEYEIHGETGYCGYHYDVISNDRN